MAFIKRTTVKGKVYYGLVESIRVKGKPKHRFIAHIGTSKPSEAELAMINLNLAGNDELVVSKSLLAKDEKSKINSFNKAVSERLKKYSALELENFKKRFNANFIYNTNAIEGSKISREEVNLILDTGQAVKGHSLREIYEVGNMLEAIKFVESHKEDLSEAFIKNIHAIVQKNIDMETLGVYKRVPNYIGNHLPTHPIFVGQKMRNMLAWYHKNKNKFSPFELACIMHLKFVFIHPFTDGNGRTARLVHNFILMKNGFSSIIFSNSNKLSYYTAINLAHENKVKPFIEYAIGEFVNTYEKV